MLRGVLQLRPGLADSALVYQKFDDVHASLCLIGCNEKAKAQLAQAEMKTLMSRQLLRADVFQEALESSAQQNMLRMALVR